MDKLCEEFEEKLSHDYGDDALLKNSDGDYVDWLTADLWEYWKASRASIVVEPTYFVLKLDESNEWGYAEDLTVYETELDASKAKDDFGGEIIPVIDLHSIGLSIKGESA